MNKKYQEACVYLLLLLFVGFPAKADNIDYLQNFALIYPLSDDWQVYDDKYSGFVPYIAERHKNSKSSSFWLDQKRFEDYYLLFYGYDDTYFFINQKLCRKFEKDGWVLMNIDSLGVIYPQKTRLFCSFYDSQGRLPLPNLQIALPLDTKQTNRLNEANNSLPDNSLDLQPRLQSGAKDFVVMLAVILLAMYAILWNYHSKTLKAFYSFRSSLSSLSRKEQSIISKPLEVGNSLFFLTQAALFAYLLLMLQLYSNTGRIYSLLDWEASFEGILLVYSQYLLGFLIGIWMKYFSLALFAMLLNQEQVIKTHFFEYFRLLALFYIGFTFVPLLAIISFPTYLPIFYDYYAYVLLVFHVFQAVLLSFYIIKLSQFKSLYLFYYLCITELTPLLIGIKLAFV